MIPIKYPFKIILLLSYTLLTFTSCPKLDYKHDFRFSNNSMYDVYVYLGVASLCGSLCLLCGSLCNKRLITRRYTEKTQRYTEFLGNPPPYPNGVTVKPCQQTSLQ